MERVMNQIARLTALVLVAVLCATVLADAAAAKRATTRRQKAVPVHVVSKTAKKKNKKQKVVPTPNPTPVPPVPTPSSPVQAVAPDSAHAVVSWAPVGGAAGYAVYRDGSLIGRVSTTAFTDSMLWPSTSYGYRVDSIAPDGVTVISSLSTSVTTPALPSAGVQPYFAGQNIWNQPVGNAQPVANSAALISYLTANALHPNMTLRSWGVSVAEAQPGQQPLFDVACVTYTCTLGAFGQVPIPVGANPDPSGDGHLAVYDPSTQREWDLWDAQRTTTGWQAGAGAAISTSGNGIAPAGTAGGNAANFPLLGGLVRPEEILQGHIDHALVFAMPHVSNLGQVCPATHHDGSSTDPNALEEGTRVQLDPSVNVDQLAIPAWEKTVARAMQVYGMYLRDQGGSLAIFAEDSASRGYDAWAKVGFAGGLSSASLAGIPWDHFRVVSAPC
jgi:hypothetical protein